MKPKVTFRESFIFLMKQLAQWAILFIAVYGLALLMFIFTVMGKLPNDIFSAQDLLRVHGMTVPIAAFFSGSVSLILSLVAKRTLFDLSFIKSPEYA